MGNERDVEKELIEFVNSLHHDMSEKDVVDLFDSLQKDHLLVESKLMLVKTVFHRVLDDAFAKEEQPKAVVPMFG
jgi:hypothetical protein